MASEADKGSLGDRLERQRSDARVALVVRVALRSYPVLFRLDRVDEKDALLVLLASRALLAAAVVAVHPNSASRSAAAFAYAAASSHGASTAYDSATAAARIAAELVTATNYDDVVETSNAFGATSAVADDLAAFEFSRAVTPEKLFQRPCWPAASRPASLDARWTSFKQSQAARSASWRFWCRWYQGFLDGNPIDWDLQLEIALIPDEHWSRGPEHIAECIDQIEAQLEVKKRAVEADRFLRTTETPQIGHNQPPEAIEDPPTDPDDLRRLIRAVRIVLTETQKASAEKAAVETAVEEIESFHRRVANWLSIKLDLTTDAFLTGFGGVAGKVTGAAAGTATTAYLLKLLDLLRPLTDAIVAWLPFL